MRYVCRALRAWVGVGDGSTNTFVLVTPLNAIWSDRKSVRLYADSKGRSQISAFAVQ